MEIGASGDFGTRERVCKLRMARSLILSHDEGNGLCGRQSLDELPEISEQVARIEPGGVVGAPLAAICSTNAIMTVSRERLRRPLMNVLEVK